MNGFQGCQAFPFISDAGRVAVSRFMRRQGPATVRWCRSPRSSTAGYGSSGCRLARIDSATSCLRLGPSTPCTERMHLVKSARGLRELGGNLGDKTALAGAVQGLRPLIPANVLPAQRS
jgi:hypothetical protein